MKRSGMHYVIDGMATVAHNYDSEEEREIDYDNLDHVERYEREFLGIDQKQYFDCDFGVSLLNNTM